MVFLHILFVEFKRLLVSKGTWLVMACSLCMPLLGYSFYTPASTATAFSAQMANPILAGGLGGAFCFSVFTLIEYDRINKYQCEAVMDSIISPLIISFAKCLSILLIASLTWLAALCLYLPIMRAALGTAFILSETLLAFSVMMLPALWMGVLASAAFYQLFRRIDLSFISFTALALFSMSKWCSDLYLIRWINPLVTVFSNDFNNTLFYRLAAYSRLLWLLIFSAFYVFSLICIRNHGLGIIGSFRIHLRKVYLPLMACLLAMGSVWLVVSEPYIDKAALVQEDEGPISSGMVYSVPADDETDYPNIDLLNQYVWLTVNAQKGYVDGNARYQLNNKTHESQWVTMLLLPGYTINTITANSKAIEYADPGLDQENSQHPIRIQLPADEWIELEVNYTGYPKVANAARSTLIGNEISADYLFMNSLSILPKLSLNEAENFINEGEVVLPANLELISLGNEAAVVSENASTKTWRFANTSSKLRFIAGDYVKLAVKDSPFPVYFYYSRRHQQEFEAMDIDKVLSDTLNYCAKQFGLLPYSEDYPLNIIMISAHFMGGGANGNFSFMGETYFSKENLSNPSKGASAAEVIAHEIIHQWWGVHSYLMDMENTDWSSEGLTVYTTYRMMKEKYNEAYVKQFYIDQWLNSLAALRNNYFLRNPDMQSMLPDKYLLNLQQLVFDATIYNKMPLQILKAEQLIGEAKMDEVLAGLFENGGTEMPPYVTWQDFLDACNLSEEELTLDQAFIESLGGEFNV